MNPISSKDHNTDSASVAPPNSLLQSATDIGHVFIVTSSEGDWVQVSAQRLLPAVHAFIGDEQNAIKVISTRIPSGQTTFNPQEWKRNVFYKELNAIFTGMTDSTVGIDVIVIGDSSAEINAARELAIIFNSSGTTPVVMKTAKLVGAPTINSLCKQLGLIIGSMDDMVSYPQFHLDLTPASSA